MLVIALLDSFVMHLKAWALSMPSSCNASKLCSNAKPHTARGKACSWTMVVARCPYVLLKDSTRSGFKLLPVSCCSSFCSLFSCQALRLQYPNSIICIFRMPAGGSVVRGELASCRKSWGIPSTINKSGLAPVVRSQDGIRLGIAIGKAGGIATIEAGRLLVLPAWDGELRGLPKRIETWEFRQLFR